jgi:hypothetical protein
MDTKQTRAWGDGIRGAEHFGIDFGKQHNASKQAS